MALKIKNREEALAVLRDMIQHKREWEEEAQREFVRARKEAENYMSRCRDSSQAMPRGWSISYDQVKHKLMMKFIISIDDAIDG